MHVVSRKALLEFASVHSDAFEPLDRWYRITKRADWAHFPEVRADFPAADTYRTLTIFDIKGNDYRLIAEINYRRGTVFVREILTHKNYDRGAWKARWVP